LVNALHRYDHLTVSAVLAGQSHQLGLDRVDPRAEQVIQVSPPAHGRP
jgi:hypothetical protein